MNWISVKERLPHEPNWLIVINNNMNIWSVAYYDHHEKKDWIFYDHPTGTLSSCGFRNEQCDGIDSKDITHWMPLPPEPGKEEELCKSACIRCGTRK